ncbi:MAG: methyltransferase domain-containing protein [Deltaproteobacteria bacterium]|nr:methyltransferase domain-containing protein [Deltaproteobacteria bacterium]
MLADVVARLTPEQLVDVARTIEARRSGQDDAALVAHHGLALHGLWTTPFAWQAAVVAREHGIVAFDRQERDLLEAPPAWHHPEFGAAYYRIERRAERVHAQNLWPFAQDMVVADFDTTLPRLWWSHGLVHALVGFGWWPDLTEWEVMAMSRLSEAVAALHWYNLAQLGRLTLADLPLDLSDLRGEHAERYASAEAHARDPGERLARLDDPAALRIAENAIDTLRYETYAYRAAIWDGDLVEPDDALYLGLGESGEYARVHHPRLVSDAHARWREACLVPGRDFATSPEQFEARAAAALEALLAPVDPGAVDARAASIARARRVLQDVGWRVCHHAALAAGHDGREGQDGSEAALSVVADALGRLGSEPAGAAPTAPDWAPVAALDPDELVAGALEAVRGRLGDAPARRVLALGYRPTLDAHKEPLAVRDIRAQALVDRAWRMHAVVGAAFDALFPVARRAVSLSREMPLLESLTNIAEGAARAEEIPWDGYGYIGWLQVAASAWFDGEPGGEARRWHYRAARRRMPEDPATWGRFVVTWNPYAKRTPSPWDARWNDELRRARPLAPGAPRPRFKPRPATAVFYALMGPGRDGPIYLPLTPHLSALVSLLKKPRTLAELCASRDFGPDFMREAIANEAVLVFHAPHVDRPERAIDIYEIAMQQAAAVEQRVEPPGPWNEPDQAQAYVEFTRSSTLYRDTSRALCDAAQIPPAARVAELGSGTGETSLEILARLGPDGILVGSDPAVLMLEHVIRRLADLGDARATFIPGAARALAFFAAGQGAFDRVIANSSLTLADSIGGELGVLMGALTAGGRVAFSLPAEYVGVVDHMVTPEAATVLGMVDRARAELGIAPPEGEKPMDPALGSLDNLRRAMTDLGYTDVRFTTYRRPWTAAEYLDWLAMPVVRKALCGKGDEARSEALIARLRELVDPSLPLESVWVLATGDKPASDPSAGQNEETPA